MNKFAILAFGLAGLGMVGCATEAAPSDEVEQAESAPRAAIGGNLLINTASNLCLRPLNGQLGVQPAEAAACGAPSQAIENWRLVNTSGGTMIVDVDDDGLCLWAFGNSAFSGDNIGIISCFIDGTRTPASNALWSLSTTNGNGTIESMLGHKHTGFCLSASGGTVSLASCGTFGDVWNIGQQ